jgi:hypothetical protein
MTSEGPCEDCGVVNTLKRTQLETTKDQKGHSQMQKKVCFSPPSPTCEVDFGGDSNSLLPDKVMCHIYSYLLRDKVLIRNDFYYQFQNRPPGIQSGLPGISELYQTVGFISKAFQRSIMSYIQLTPIDFGNEFSSYKTCLWWACSRQEKTGRKLKLNRCTAHTNGPNSSAVSQFMLESSDLSELRDFSIYAACCQMRGDYSKAENAFEGGFPHNFFHERKTASIDSLQRYVAATIPHHALKLQRLNITTTRTEFHMPMLQNFVHSPIEVLRLHYTCQMPPRRNDYRNDSSDIQKIGEIISQFQKLKKLILNISFGCQPPFKFILNSETLEEINMIECDSLFLDECNCPNLKILKCKHRNQYLSKAIEEANGVRVAVAEAFTDDELDGKKVLRVEAGSREFIGMNVPRECIIELKCDWGK